MNFELDDEKNNANIWKHGLDFADAFTEPNEDAIRIISLRRAIKYEREQFEQAFKNRLGSGGRHDR